MSFREHPDYLLWRCEDCDATAEFERVQRPGYFLACVDEIKARGWLIGRTRDGDWTHRCAECRKGSAEKVLAMTSKRFG